MNNFPKEHEDSLKYYRDLKNSLDTAKEEGLIEGEQIGMQKGEQIGMRKAKYELASNAKKMGMAIKDIVALTGFTEKEISEM